jgi:hypothetical protein
VIGTSPAVFRVFTLPAGLILFGKAASEYLKTVLPHIGEAVIFDIPLDGLIVSRNVKARSYIAVMHDSGHIYSRVAEEIPVSYLCLVFFSEVMTAGVFNRQTRTLLYSSTVRPSG